MNDELDADEVAKSIAEFDIIGWSKITADDISIEKISNGYINRTWKVTNKRHERHGDGVSSLIYKKYGGNIHHVLGRKLFRMNSPLIQSLIFYEQSSRGWGPKLYGLLDDGRIEEYIDSDTLTPSTAFIPQINEDMARTFARFHSMDVPIDKTLYMTIDETVNALDHLAAIKQWIQETPPEPDVLRAINSVIQFPSLEEYKWCKKIISRTKHRTVLCTMDANYLNRLVRRDKPRDARANQTVIIDFDISAYSHRGYDIGGHFANSIFRVFDRTASTADFPSKAQRETFLSAYLQESKKLLRDFDDTGLDSMDNLKIETEIHTCIYLLWLILLSHIFCRTPQVTNHYYFEPAIDAYNQLKRQFCLDYPHIVQ